MIAKAADAHLRRRAVVYLRQSSLKQVMEHTESTRRQYELRERAIALGWRADAIEIIDEDLGRSGSTSEGRSGFKRLSEDIARGIVGAVFALDVSRLARSSADWHRLLDLCGIADVLIADEQALYHPADHNDRLLLGIKGTMSEAELTWMRLRLRGARMNKARRGEHFLPPPIGYEWDGSTHRLRLDPDGEVQRAVRLVFERFQIERSAYGVARYFIEHGLRVPARAPGSRELTWSAPRPSRILQLLVNPTYAGAYVFGRRQYGVGLRDGQVVRSCRRISVDAWKIVHHGRHPAYISWDEYVSNQRILLQNRPARDAPERHGAARDGDALLQGIVLCGRCGGRMNAVYGGKQRHPRYSCHSPAQRGEQMQTCWSVAAKGVDQHVADLVLSVVQPSGIELGLAVLRESEQQVRQLEEQWRLRVERARYEARLAERRYKAVDPDNRVVARALEREWEDRLKDLGEIERRIDERRHAKKVELDVGDRDRLLALTRSLPKLWTAPSTTMTERKNIVRTLIREVCLTPTPRSRGTRVAVLWQTGATDEATIDRQLPGRQASREASRFIEELVKKAVPATDIAEQLNERGLVTTSGMRWTNLSVHRHCLYRDIRWPKRMPSSRPRPARRRDGLYSVRGVAAELGVTENAVRYWLQRRWLRPHDRRGGPLWFRLDELTIRRLKKIRDAHTRSASRRDR